MNVSLTLHSLNLLFIISVNSTPINPAAQDKNPELAWTQLIRSYSTLNHHSALQLSPKNLLPLLPPVT